MVKHRPPIDTVTHGHYRTARLLRYLVAGKPLEPVLAKQPQCRSDDKRGETPAANSQSVCEGRYRNGIGQSAELLPNGTRYGFFVAVAVAADAAAA